MADFWPLSVSIESMGNTLLLRKILSLKAMVKPTKGWRALAIHVVINLNRYCYENIKYSLKHLQAEKGISPSGI